MVLAVRAIREAYARRTRKGRRMAAQKKLACLSIRQYIRPERRGASQPAAFPQCGQPLGVGGIRRIEIEVRQLQVGHEGHGGRHLECVLAAQAGDCREPTDTT
jgi:hypothetical protein